ncbi:MAG: plastocyanin/azurin family copper-binding protein [Dehalococcoidia bacterium]
MKLDLTKLPVGEMMIGFLILSLGLTFALAYTYVDTPQSPAAETPEPTGNGGSETPPPGAPEVVMRDSVFDPDEFIVIAGETVTFAITNEGALKHNMHIASPDGEFTVSGVCETGDDEPCSDPDQIDGGETGTLTWEVPADAAGSEIPFRCDFHTADMTGTITVQ